MNDTIDSSRRRFLEAAAVAIAVAPFSVTETFKFGAVGLFAVCADRPVTDRTPLAAPPAKIRRRLK